MPLATDSALNEVIRIAENAGKEIMRIYDSDFAVMTKSDSSPLTDADRAANDVILAALSRLEPGVPILSEESIESFDRKNLMDRYWLVDPLDGTKEFIKRNGEFTVNIALVEFGKPVAGVVHAPAIGQTYFAARGVGSFRKAGAEPSRRINAQSRTADEAWRVVCSRSHSDGAEADFLQRLERYERIPMGSSLKICLVAEGRAHVYPRLGPTSYWDTAAAHCVATEAGAFLCDLRGTEMSYCGGDRRYLNPHFVVGAAQDYDKVLGMLASAGC